VLEKGIEVLKGMIAARAAEGQNMSPAHPSAAR
jgi:hypothetical protein